MPIPQIICIEQFLVLSASKVLLDVGSRDIFLAPCTAFESSVIINHLTTSSLSNVKPIIFHLEKKECFDYELIYEGWNFNSGNYLFTTDTK